VILSYIKERLQAWLCAHGRHRPAVWSSTVGAVQIDWQKHYAVHDRHCQRVLLCCGVLFGEPEVVGCWAPMEQLGIPNMCPRCRLVHDRAVRCP